MAILTIREAKPVDYQFLTDHWKAWIVFIPIGYLIASMTLSALQPGLRNIPGPILARFSRYFLFREAIKGNGHTLYRQLHARYGTIVRVGPGKVSIADPDMIDQIYDISSKYRKSTFYDAFTSPYHGKILNNIFATRDMEWHKSMKTSVASAYSMSALRPLEPLIDECSALFMDAMRDLVGQPIDLGKWVQWYAFDVIGQITFSRSFDFLKERQDKLGVIDGIEAGNQYNSVIGQIPELHPWLIGNERLINLLMRIPALAKANPIMTLNRMMLDAMSSKDATRTIRREDFLKRLRTVQEKNPGRLTDRDISTALLSNLFAGSDTIAMALRAVFYFLVKHPDVYRKLTAEIDLAIQRGELSEMVEFQQGLKLKYLQAVIKEAQRLHPGVGLPLERTVPEGGAMLCGRFLPAGTVVGMHAWVIHHDKNVFGEDADVFRPERWLESDSRQLKKMDHCFMSFGHGARICLGKNIALLELTKIVPQLLREFDLTWASLDDEWKISGYFFAKQSSVIMQLSSRNA